LYLHLAVPSSNLSFFEVNIYWSDKLRSNTAGALGWEIGTQLYVQMSDTKIEIKNPFSRATVGISDIWNHVSYL